VVTNYSTDWGNNNFTGICTLAFAYVPKASSVYVSKSLAAITNYITVYEWWFHPDVYVLVAHTEGRADFKGVHPVVHGSY